MDDLPELETARRILRQGQPPEGAKGRVLHQIRENQRRHTPRRRLGTWAFTAAAILATTTAVAWQQDWIPSWFQTSHGSTDNARSVSSTPREVAPGRSTTTQPAAPEQAPVADPAPKKEASVTSQAPVKAPRDLQQQPVVAKGADRTELSEQVEAYQKAVALSASNPASSYEALLEFRRKWPASALRRETDVRIVQMLLRLGRSGEAANEACRFVSRYGDDPKREEMQRICKKAAADP